MKSIFLGVMLAVGILLSFYASSMPLNEMVDVYVGGDAQIRRMGFKGGYGENLLNKHSPQGNIYGGVNLNENFALEAGYESTISRSKTVVLVNGQVVNGMHVPPHLSPIVLKSKSKIKGFHFDLLGFYDLSETSPWRIFASLGFCEMKGTVERVTLAAGPHGAPGRTRTFCKRHTALRLGTGMQYRLNECLSFRGSVNMVRTGKMTINVSDAHQSIHVPVFKPRDSLVFGVGALYNF